jgi:hypothetical protein
VRKDSWEDLHSDLGELKTPQPRDAVKVNSLTDAYNRYIVYIPKPQQSRSPCCQNPMAILRVAGSAEVITGAAAAAVGCSARVTCGWCY